MKPCHIWLAAVITAWTGIAAAQPIEITAPVSPAHVEAAENIGFTKGSIIVAPIPFQNPALESGLALGGAYLYKADPDSDTSFVGLGGFRTSNESQGYGLGANFNTGSNRWKTSLVAVDVDLNYDLYFRHATLPISQSGRALRFELGYGVMEHLTIGAGLGYAETMLSPHGGFLPSEYVPDLEVNLVKGDVFADWDTRDDTMYPNSGVLVSGKLSYGKITNFRGRTYTKAVLSVSGYHQVLGEGILAGKTTFCSSSDKAPFFDSCGLGMVDAFRGYSSTQFIDNALASLQLEYRGRRYGRFGYVVFAGAGAVGDSLGSALDGPFHTAAGMGLRYRLSKSFPVDYVVDMSVNEEGEKLLYISIGQRF